MIKKKREIVVKSFNSDKLDFFVEGELLKFEKNDLRDSPNNREIETVSNFLKKNIKPNDTFIFMSYFTGNLQKEFFDRMSNTGTFERIEFLKDILNFSYKKFYNIKESTNDFSKINTMPTRNNSAWEEIDNKSGNK
jgi:hypothetical protein